jgi:hypothetical protein
MAAAASIPVADSINSRYQWKLKSDAMAIIVDAHGTIFGGAVRDMVIHNHFARKFYDAVDDPVAATDLYSDPTYRPDLADRLIVPKDLDVFIEEEHVDELLNRLTRRGFAPVLHSKKDPLKYLSESVLLEGEVEHRKYLLQCSTPIPRGLRDKYGAELISLEKAMDGQRDGFVMDLMVKSKTCTRDIKPPFGPVDFRCNSLLMNSSGLSSSEGGVSALLIVIDDCISKTAYAQFDARVPEWRIKKMLLRGWKVPLHYLKNLGADEDGFELFKCGAWKCGRVDTSHEFVKGDHKCPDDSECCSDMDGDIAILNQMIALGMVV